MSLSLAEYKQQYGGLEPAKLREKISTDKDFRKATESLYEAAYQQKLNHSCSNCWEDAYILLMRLSVDKFQMMSSRRYYMKGGAVLIDPKDSSKMFNRHTMTDELAAYYLSRYPDMISLFERYPATWQQEVTDSALAQSAAKKTKKPSNRKK